VALTDTTEALLTEEPPFSRDAVREALRWSYSTRIRDDTEPPTRLTPVVRWLERNTMQMTAFTERGTSAGHARAMLARISQTKDGGPAAANTANRKRMVLGNAMEYACEIDVLTVNPLKAVKWTKPRTLTTVDPRVVINGAQAPGKPGQWATCGLPTPSRDLAWLNLVPLADEARLRVLLESVPVRAIQSRPLNTASAWALLLLPDPNG